MSIFTNKNKIIYKNKGHMKKALESGETNSSEEFTKEIAEIEDLIKSVEENIRGNFFLILQIETKF